MEPLHIGPYNTLGWGLREEKRRYKSGIDKRGVLKV